MFEAVDRYNFQPQLKQDTLMKRHFDAKAIRAPMINTTTPHALPKTSPHHRSYSSSRKYEDRAQDHLHPHQVQWDFVSAASLAGTAVLVDDMRCIYAV